MTKKVDQNEQELVPYEVQYQYWNESEITYFETIHAQSVLDAKMKFYRLIEWEQYSSDDWEIVNIKEQIGSNK